MQWHPCGAAAASNFLEAAGSSAVGAALRAAGHLSWRAILVDIFYFSPPATPPLPHRAQG